MRTLDNYLGTIHPDIFDARVDGIWPISSSMIATLETDFAKAIRVYETEETERRRYFDFPHEETFRVYVYDIKEVPELEPLTRGGAFCKALQWGAEVQLHFFFLQSHTYTSNPAEADFFFVPQYTACHLNVGTYKEEQSTRYFEALIPKLPYFRRTQGRDHIFAFTSGMAVDGPFATWRNYIKDSIFIMAESELWNPYRNVVTPSYSVHKDILIPGYMSLSAIRQQDAGNIHDREYIGDFVGWNRPLHDSQQSCFPDGKCMSPRESLLRMANMSELHIRQDVPFIEALKGAGLSHFCFVPRGKSAWSSRLFRVLFAGCIPVLLNDYCEIPFDEFLNIQQWMIKWPMRNVDVDQLLRILRDVIDTGTGMMMRLALERERCWFVYPPSIADSHYDPDALEDLCPRWKKQNAFLGVMRLLARKSRMSKNSPNTFFFPVKDKLIFVNENFEILE